ncbi:MAG: hypothetical protein ACR2NA_04525 [Solirubrobacterales bacterium]
MIVLVFAVLGFATLVLAWGVGIGGQVGSVLALAVIFLGVLLYMARPIIDWVTKP